MDDLWVLAQHHSSLGSYASAAFYSDKLISLCGKAPEEMFEYVYFLAQCYYRLKEYPRVAHVMEKFALTNYCLKGQVLAAQAMLAAKNYHKCFRILQEQVLAQETDVHLLALKHVCFAQAYEARESKQTASEHYVLALQTDPTNIEAFQALVKGQLLSADAELKLISSLVIPESHSWLHQYYLSCIKMPSTPAPALSSLEDKHNSDILCVKAEQLFAAQKVDQAYELASRIIRADPYHLQAVPLHAACMVALHEVGELYNLSHNLVKDYAESAVAWYAAGAYYYSIKKYDMARKFFMKAQKLDKSYLPAWIAYGHTFAAQDLSDQAMSAYRIVARLFPGCHLANLYMGMEYLRTKNLKTALLSFELAKSVTPNDPVVWNEIGVVHYKKQE